MDGDGALPTDAAALVLRLPPWRGPGVGGAVMVVRVGAVVEIADAARGGHRLPVLEEAAGRLVGIIGEAIAAIAAIAAVASAMRGVPARPGPTAATRPRRFGRRDDGPGRRRLQARAGGRGGGESGY